jgi:four helix bundle protein
MKTFRGLIVWQKSIAFVTNIYKSVNTFPKEELYGLTSQIKRSAVSVPSNIAEGYGRKSTKEFIRFLRIAMGSLFEIQTQLEISKNLNFFDEETYSLLYEDSREIERMLSSLIDKLSTKN